MAILNYAGFETGDLTEFMNTAGTTLVQSTIVRGGIYALKTDLTSSGTGTINLGAINANGQSAGTSKSTLYTKFHFLYTKKPVTGDEPIQYLTAKFELRINSDCRLNFYNRSNSLLGTGSTVLQPGTWYRIELCTTAGSAGAYELRVDGVTELSGVGDFGAANFTGMFVGRNANRNGQSVCYYYDDLAMDDSAWVGDCSVASVHPTGVGSSDSYSNFGGANKTVSVTNNDGDTSYVNASSPNTFQSFLVEPPASRGITGTVAGVKCIATIRYPATSSSGRSFIRSKGATSLVTNPGYTTSSYAPNSKILLLEPSAGVPWTVSDLDALEIGAATNASGSGITNVTRLIGMILYTPAPAGCPRMTNYYIRRRRIAT